MKRVIFPEGNRRDYEEVAADLKKGITPHFVSSFEEVFELALGGRSSEGYEEEGEGGEAAVGEGEKEKSGGGGGVASAARARFGGWW